VSVEVLLSQFERVAEAPDAVGRLRRFIVNLAVQGRLVSQDPADELASELLARIPSVDARRSSSSHDMLVQSAQVPFEVPAGWMWVAFGRLVVRSDAGWSPKTENFARKDDKWGVLKVSAVSWDSFRPEENKQLLPDSIPRLDAQVRVGNFLISRANTSELVAKAVVVRETPANLMLSDKIVRLTLIDEVVPHFLLLVNNHAHYAREYYAREASGASPSMKNVSREVIYRLPIPFPPLDEQRRIVDKVAELMAICDELEAIDKEKESRTDVLRRALLKPPTISYRDEASTDNKGVRFFLERSPRLITKPKHVETVRQAILDLAIRGRLVPQDPTEEPAANLLDRIKARREEMLSENFPNAAEARTQWKKQSQQKMPSELQNLPAGWKWATLMQCSALVVDCRNKTAPYTSSGITLLRTTNVRDGRIILGGHRYVSEDTYQQWSSRYRPQPGDIVITREAPMGEVAKIPAGLTVCLGQRLMLCRLIEETMSADFLVYSLRDSVLMERVQDKPIGALVEHLRVGGVETLLIPVPPLAEQHRIVAKVDELMALCDELEDALARTQTERVQLLEALLRDILNENAKRVPSVEVIAGVL
jgi:type I restriction enzyme S subunit